MTEEDVLAFARRSFSSVWELDLLLLLHASPDRAWTRETATTVLRASRGAVDQAVRNLKNLDLVEVLEGERIRYRREGGAREEAVQALAQLWKEKPFAVINAIHEAQADPGAERGGVTP